MKFFSIVFFTKLEKLGLMILLFIVNKYKYCYYYKWLCVIHSNSLGFSWDPGRREMISHVNVFA